MLDHRPYMCFTFLAHKSVDTILRLDAYNSSYKSWLLTIEIRLKPRLCPYEQYARAIRHKLTHGDSILGDAVCLQAGSSSEL